MRKIAKIHFYPFIMLSMIIIFAQGCKKEDENPESSPTTELEGTWVGREVNGGGEIVTLSCTKDKIATSSPGEWYNGSFIIQGEAYPKNIDITVSQCSYAPYIGETSLGIFKISNDSLYLAGNEFGVPVRASSFTANNATRFFIFVRN